MKINKKVLISTSIVLATGLSVSMFGGCGGGGGSSESPITTVELTAASAEELAVNAADALPGCSYTSDNVISAPSSVDTVVKTVAQAITVSNDEPVGTRSTAAYTIDERYEGTCPTNPGYATEVGSHDDGVDDVVYTFVNYCLGDDIDNVIVNGVADVKDVGEPSDLGPIPQYTEINSGDDGIQVTENSSEGSYVHVAKFDDVVYSYGNGDDGASSGEPSSITADSLSIKDGRSEETFSISNVNVSTYYADPSDTAISDVVFEISNITYTDPEVGAVNVKTTSPIVDNDTNGIISGEIQVSGSNDEVVTMTLSESVADSFDVVFNGEELGLMDCSGLSTEGLPEDL